MDANAEFTKHWTSAQPLVVNFIRSLVHDFDQADDILQEVALTALKRFDDFDPSRPFTAWAIGIARNKVLSARRSHARSIICTQPGLMETLSRNYEQMIPELTERGRALQRCVERVDGPARTLLELRYEQGLAPRMIAERLEQKAPNIRVKLSRIRAALENCIKKRLARQGA